MSQADEASLKERRTCIRIDARLRTTYRLLGSHHNVNSVTRDISAIGISLLTEIPFAPSVVLQIDVELPVRGRTVSLICRVVWSQPLVLPDKALEPRLFETGGFLLDIAPDDQALLMQACTKD
jgi:hypothetical protein